jgi:TonB family protein
MAFANSGEHRDGDKVEVYNINIEDQKEGEYTLFYKGQPEINGFYRNGVREGKWVFRCGKDFMQTGIFTNGKPDSVWNCYNKGNLTDMYDYRTGQSLSYGSKGELYFKGDSVNGGYLAEAFYDNGKVKQRTCPEGNLERYTSFDKKGETLDDILYKNELPYNILRQSPISQYMYEGQVKDGTGNLVIKRKITNLGEYENIVSFGLLNSERDGSYKEYDSKGNLIVSGNFTNGFMTGEWHRFVYGTKTSKISKQYKSSDSIRSDTTIFERFRAKRPDSSIGEMPSFRGGQNYLLSFISNSLIYPSEARKQRIEGRVIVRFVVSPFGQVEKIQILSKPQPLLDQEAYRVVKSMPNWIPGTQNGCAVPTYFTLPIVFSMRN